MLLAGALLFLMGAQLVGSTRAAAVNETISITGNRVTVTLNGTQSWRLGKVQRPETGISGGISINDGYRAVDFYETPTYRLQGVDTVTVRTSIPDPARSRVEMRVITSNLSDFGDGSRSYQRRDETVYPLGDGARTVAVPQLDGGYYRVFFALNRTSPDVPTPRIHALQFIGDAPSDRTVVPDIGGRNP